MNAEMIGVYLPAGIALLAIMFFLSRRRLRNAKRARAATSREDTREQIRNWQEAETEAFEDYKERLERQRALIERYNREHKNS